MFKYLLLLGISFFVIRGGIAQESEWTRSGDGTTEYNCDTYASLRSTLESSTSRIAIGLSDEPIARIDGSETISVAAYIGTYTLLNSQQGLDSEFTFEDILSEIASVCNAGSNIALSGDVLFNVVVSGGANLRSCAGTHCDIVGQVASGDLLAVIEEEGDWYQVQTEDGTAFIASFLVTRGPDEVISVDEPYFDTRTGCSIIFDIRRGDMDINFILSGTNRRSVLVDLYRPNETRPLDVAGQLDKTFIDTGEPYVHQYYSWNVGYPMGLYNIEISLDGDTSRLAWELEAREEYYIYIDC